MKPSSLYLVCSLYIGWWVGPEDGPEHLHVYVGCVGRLLLRRLVKMWGLSGVMGEEKRTRLGGCVLGSDAVALLEGSCVLL